jgi:hypothetical protein
LSCFINCMNLLEFEQVTWHDLIIKKTSIGPNCREPHLEIWNPGVVHKACKSLVCCCAESEDNMVISIPSFSVFQSNFDNTAKTLRFFVHWIPLGLATHACTPQGLVQMGNFTLRSFICLCVRQIIHNFSLANPESCSKAGHARFWTRNISSCVRSPTKTWQEILLWFWQTKGGLDMKWMFNNIWWIRTKLVRLTYHLTAQQQCITIQWFLFIVLKIPLFAMLSSHPLFWQIFDVIRIK